jgi:putative restriction endonuclease
VHVLKASHIKPWRKCTGKEDRLDPQNGLLLNATLDALFDRGLISFNDDGAILISRIISDEEQRRLGIEKQMKLSKQPSPKQIEYLRSHRRLFQFGG